MINFEIIKILLNSTFFNSNRLKQMLIDEQQMFEDEFLSTVKTPLERQAELREKAKQIRIKGANEQAEFVQKKLDQKWRFVILLKILLKKILDFKIILKY